MRGIANGQNPLSAGFYTVRDAARLIEVGNQQRIKSWLRGYPKRKIGPLLERDYHPIEGKEELSFLDLMEVRFVEYFREQGVRTNTLRKALITAREVFKESKPLASKKLIFRTTENRKSVLVEEVLRPVAKSENDKRLWSLMTRQYEFYELIVDRLAQGVVFDPKTALVSKWTPRPKEFPEIYIQPSVAYGMPVLPSRVPVRTIYDAWLAEEGNWSTVVDWFNIPLGEVEMAVEFERSLTVRSEISLQ